MFDFEKFKNGEAATTKLGNVAKFVCESRGKMVVAVTPREAVYKTGGIVYSAPAIKGTRDIIKYNFDGTRYGRNCPTTYDLDMVAN